MAKIVKRRNFLKSALYIPALAKSNLLFSTTVSSKNSTHSITPAHKLKISLNAFSFNAPLTDGSMHLDDLLEFCSGTIIQAVDLTGYYFPGYPAVPSDEYIYHIKQKAFHLGLDISGTGVRNDFTDPDEKKRREHITLVKNWIECASKLGAPVIRLFAGTQNLQGYTWDQVAKWMMKDIEECIDYGKKHGVI